MSNFYGGQFFGGGFFGATGGGARPDDGPSVGKRKQIVKPTGLPVGKRKTLTLPQGRRSVDERAEEAARIQAEVTAQVASEFRSGTIARQREQARIDELLAKRQIEAEIERQEAITLEIARLLRKKLRTEEDEVLLLLLMAAGSVA